VPHFLIYFASFLLCVSLFLKGCIHRHGCQRFCNLYSIPSFCCVIEEFVWRHTQGPLPQPFRWIPLKFLNDPKFEGPDSLIVCWLMLRVKFHTHSLTLIFKQGTSFLGFLLGISTWHWGTFPSNYKLSTLL